MSEVESTGVDESGVTVYRIPALLPWLPFHGFAGVGAERYINKSFPNIPVIRLKQCHSAVVKDYSLSAEGIEAAEPEQADGMILKRPQKPAAVPTKVYAIVTADCLPLLLWNQRSIALVHAGWRGLAEGIIESAIDKMGGVHGAIAGPAAGKERYEVGSEVIEAIGETAVCEKQSKGKYLLDVQETGLRQVRECSNPEMLGKIPVCTITSENFHSHRREPSCKLRNFSYLAL